MPPRTTPPDFDAEPLHHRHPHHAHVSGYSPSSAPPSHRSTFPVSLVARAVLLVSAIVLTGCPDNEREMEAVREAARIAEEARHEQAEQTRTFAELESTLSQERQSIDQERAQAAERHDQAAQSRERAIQAHREVNEAAARDRFFGQALLACGPILLVAVAIWAALRLAQFSYAGSSESDSAIAEVLLLESHLKTTWYDPGMAARLVTESRLGLPDGTNSGDAGDPEDDAPDTQEGSQDAHAQDHEGRQDDTPEDPNEPRPF